MKKNICSWVSSKPDYIKYHDNEWGVPLYSDNKLFEMLILEGAQAGLSWETVLLKRSTYRSVFNNFNPIFAAEMNDNYLNQLLKNPGLIRNKLKIYSVRQNAKVFLDIQNKHKSFSSFIWKYVNNEPIINHWVNHNCVPTKTKISEEISKDLKKLGMKFVGPTIIYAYMQAIGMVNDHTIDCWKHPLNS